MFDYFKEKSVYNIISNFTIVLFLIILFYKIFFEYLIPISGDELNSILIYSSNIKTLFLKNYPGNVTFFHFVGYIKSKLIGFDLLSFRSITFIFFVLHFWILKKLNLPNSISLIFFILLINSYFAFYVGQYVGYVFTSFIFLYIFYLIKGNYNEENDKLILFLLFIQIYNHLVNLYLVAPIIICLFAKSKKKKFIKNFIFFFLIPVIFFYLFSIILTGIAEQKISNTNLDFIFLFFLNNIENIFNLGINRIFFYELYAEAEKFNPINFLNNLLLFDKIYFIFFISSVILSLVNLKTKKIELFFSFIIILHIIFLLAINKDPAPRIFSGFICFYIFFNFYYLSKYSFFNYLNSKIVYFLIFGILLLSIYNFNFFELIKKSKSSADFNFDVNNRSKMILNENCELKNYNFSELQKRNFYFNYLIICKKEFNLNQFLTYYRS